MVFGLVTAAFGSVRPLRRPQKPIFAILKREPDYPVMIPYSELCDLLDTVRQIKAYKAEVERFRNQVLALRIMQQECMEKIRELEQLL